MSHAAHLEAVSHSKWKVQPASPGEKNLLVQEEFTNMPLFGRVHKCKEYEY